MEVTTIDSVGRIVVPKPLRDALGLTPGTKLDVSRYGAGLQLVPAGRTARLAYRDGVLVGTGGTGSTTTSCSPDRRRSPLTALGLDTSAAIPLLVETHDEHEAVARWCNRREVILCGHAVAETYAVLTRLPGTMRFARTRALTRPVIGADTARQLPEGRGRLAIAGGAVHDALVALAAVEHDATLATRDARARSTYELVGARVVVAG